MKKLLIAGMMLISLGVAGCGNAAPAPTKQEANIPWEEIKKEVFTGHLGFFETMDRIDKTKYDHETKETLRAIAGEIDYRGYVDTKTIQTEAEVLWNMKKEKPDTWLFEYEQKKQIEFDNRFIEEK